jgi:cephalosporin hydroxylase
MAKRVSKNPKFGGWIDLPSGIILYTVTRKFKPEIVIETGVGPGASSAFILKALEDNKKGKLYSIDLPGNDAVVYPKLGKDFNIHIPEGFEVGWLIPNWLKHRHELIIGDSTVELPKLLLKLGKVDVFLHDSLHTDEHVLFELNTVIS